MTMEMMLLLCFVFAYSITVINDSKRKTLVFLNSVILMLSGLLLTFLMFRVSMLEEYREWEYVVGFLVSMNFALVLPAINEAVVKVATAKLKEFTKKMTEKK